jgi:hypothetical protein
MTIQQWFYDLESESRLNQTLSTYMAIDHQIRNGAPVTAAVEQATKQLSLGLTGIQERVERVLLERLDLLSVTQQDSVRQVASNLGIVVQGIATEIRSLVEQGKSATEVQSTLKEATGALQSFLVALKLPGVRGEEGEKNVIRDLQDAFLGQTCIGIEPIGGADATDAVITFYRGEVEIGRSLVEVKSRNSWSNDFVVQVREDMKRYNTAFAILAVEKLPKSAKARRFHVDAGEGLVIIASPELVTPTVSMFYEIHSASHKLQKKALDLGSLAADRDLTFYINDNMKTLEDCKKISDTAEDSSRKIKEYAASIGSRLQDNNRKIAGILAKVAETGA